MRFHKLTVTYLMLDGFTSAVLLIEEWHFFLVLKRVIKVFIVFYLKKEVEHLRVEELVKKCFILLGLEHFDYVEEWHLIIQETCVNVIVFEKGYHASNEAHSEFIILFCLISMIKIGRLTLCINKFRWYFSIPFYKLSLTFSGNKSFSLNLYPFCPIKLLDFFLFPKN